MLFNSLQFAVFFFMVTAWYYAVGHRWRWLLLAVASCYFYMVFVPYYILILLVLILVDYSAGLLIEASSGTRRKLFLVASLVANVGMLGAFKYFNFLSGELARITGWVGWPAPRILLDVVLPIGLSFHTFQSMSYTIEVYRGNQRAERHFGIYALYVLFYPQMVAGPIERPQNLLAQLHSPVQFDYRNLTDGLQLIVWGLFKKMVIADNLAKLVDPVFSDPVGHAGAPVLLSLYAFTLQIFCDFSGYSDIARGAAQAMGIRLMLNFDCPYHARSIGEFWRRWHISLSTWFRDYVYKPMGGSRVSRLRTIFNVLTVFLISGFWHGASWAFVAWGALHGLYLVIGQATNNWRARWRTFCGLEACPRLRAVLAVAITFHLVLISWVLFRAGTLHHAWTVVDSLRHWQHGPTQALAALDNWHWWGCLGGLVVMETLYLIKRQYPLRPGFAKLPATIQVFVFLCGLAAIALWGRFESHDFIYFQF